MTRQTSSSGRPFLVIAAAAIAGMAHAAPPKVDFATDVAPIFEAHCIRCHAPGIDKGDISLATIADLQANGYLSAGDPDGSYLLELIAGADGQPPAMPKEGRPLSAEEVDLIRRWIAGGGAWPDDVVVREKPKADASWWAFQPLRELQESNLSPPERIDDFLRAGLDEHGLQINQSADRRTFIRRATYDLIGLPPSPAEVEAFVDDADAGAYERLIDRLLASPHYGERWGRHWLDVVRFGESRGFERNEIINELWPFRDYVIRSINEDKPFDQFLREHLAGDVMGKDDPDVAIGSAFLVAGPYDDVGNQDAAQAAQIRANTIDEIIRATSEALLGMTIGCARCHDHKFDPIRQEDYYSLYATFAGIRHGLAPLAHPDQRRARDEALAPLSEQKSTIEQAIRAIDEAALARAESRAAAFDRQWTRPPVARTGVEERIAPTTARFVRLVCEAADTDPASNRFTLDEFEIWTAGDASRNVALARNGAKASGKSRTVEDFPGVYGPHLAIDGKTGARFISAGDRLTIELVRPFEVSRFVFFSARGEANPEQGVFGPFPAEYRIELSLDGNAWTEVAHGRDRKPVSEAHRRHRLLQAEITEQEVRDKQQQRQALADVNREIARVPNLPNVWIGTRSAEDARGPFHLFIGGSPQRKGAKVVPASLSVLDDATPGYQLADDVDEARRRMALARWITRADNPLTARVLANRLWHYHFGRGIVDTPNDFGYMGGRPTHPELLDFLAVTLVQHGWRIKPLHRMIMLSEAYRQSSQFREEAASVDGDNRLLWRFPPRRLSAEEVRDTVLQIAGKLDRKPLLSGSPAGSDVVAAEAPASVPDGGPGFRLYHYMQDNVSTYVPLDKHGPETYRRSVYHQNARASIVDLMTEFDQPDCTYSAPRRSATTTPLQALTMLNHSFILDMAAALAERLHREAGEAAAAQVERAYQLCFARGPSEDEIAACCAFVEDHGLSALCRVLLNTSEMIYVR